MKRLLLLVLPVFMLVTACGGGGGSSSSTSSDGGNGGGSEDTITSLGGIVTDPAVSGAVVELRMKSDDSVAVICGTAGNLTCRTATDESGTFSLKIPVGTDLSGYYIKSFGGVDTETGIDMESFSFESPVEAFSDDMESVVVSPVTTVMMSKGGTVDDMIAYVRTVLALSDSTDPLADPTTNAELFKRSYILVNMAVAYRDMAAAKGEDSESEPLELISKAAAKGALFGSDGSLVPSQVAAIYLEFASNDGYDDDITELTGIVEVINNVDNSSSIVDSVLRAAITKYFKEAVFSMLDDIPDEPVAAFATNLGTYINAIISSSDSIAADRFVIAQIVRYTMLNDYGLDTYNDFIADDFSETIAAMTAYKDFSTDIANIISTGPTYVVSVPLKEGEVLGNDNAKRVAYYYNSNIDLSYKARQLSANIKDDKVNDDIAIVVVKNYGVARQFTKAVAAANSLIVNTTNQAEAFLQIADDLIASGDSVSAVEYMERASDLVKNIHDADPDEPFSTTEIKLLVRVMDTYNEIGESEKGSALEAYIIDAMNALNEKYLTSVYSKFCSAVRDNIEDMIENGADVSIIESRTDTFVRYVDLLPAASSTGKKYSLHLIYLTDAMEFYYFTGAYQKVIDTYHNKIVPRKESDAAEKGWIWQAYLRKVTGFLYGSGDKEAAIELLNSLDHSDSYRAAGSENIAKVMYEDDMAGAIAIYEIYNPMDKDYGNIGDYIDSWTYFAANESNEGIAMEAISKGKKDLALAALDYISGKMDEAVRYFDDNHVNYGGYLSDMISGTPSFSVSNAYNEAGYTKLAYLYSLIDESEKATAALDKALAYLDGSNTAVLKATGYGTLADMARDIDPTYDTSGMRAKAREVFIAATLDSDTFDAEDLFRMKYSIARDYYLVGDKESSESAFDEAVVYAQAVFTGRTGDDKEDKDNSRHEVEYLNYISNRYGDLLNIDKAKNTLEKSIISAADRLSDSYILSSYKSIMQQYAHLRLYDYGYAKAGTLFKLHADFNDGVTGMIEEMLIYDDFPDSDVATFDLDKDGKPDFFSPDATDEEIADSGLELDDDIDGDGILDIEDTTPFYAN